MREKVVRAGVRIAEIAARQHGVVRLDQLVLAGLEKSAITRWVAAGRLHRLHRGVYAVGHTKLSQEGIWIAAVFAYGPRAVLSHDSAASLWHLSPSASAVVHVTVPASGTRGKRPGIRLHYSSTLGPRDTTLRHNIPVTTRERTLADMGWGSEPTRSHLERLFLKLIRRAGLPMPEVNAKLGPYTVDVLWRPQRLVVELDGYAFHSSPASFEQDRSRDRYLIGRGFTVLRFTYREVTEEPDIVVADVRTHLR
jgi:very-short-patch-repair endonuclease